MSTDIRLRKQTLINDWTIFQSDLERLKLSASPLEKPKEIAKKTFTDLNQTALSLGEKLGIRVLPSRKLSSINGPSLSPKQVKEAIHYLDSIKDKFSKKTSPTFNILENLVTAPKDSPKFLKQFAKLNLDEILLTLSDRFLPSIEQIVTSVFRNTNLYAYPEALDLAITLMGSCPTSVEKIFSDPFDQLFLPYELFSSKQIMFILESIEDMTQSEEISEVCLNDEYKRDLWFLSCEKGFLEPFNKILSMDFDASDEASQTEALFLAVKNENMNILERLSSLGANINVTDIKGNSLFLKAIKTGNLDLISFLKNHGASIEAIDSHNRNAVHIALENLQAPLEIVSFLIENGFDLKTKNKNDETFLLLSAKYGSLECFKLFSDKGLDLKAKNKHGETALHFGILNNDLKIIHEIFNRGITYSSCSNPQLPLLHLALESGNKEIFDLLITKAPSINEKDDSLSSTFHVACINGNIEIIKNLVELGIDINARDQYGDNALHDTALEDKINVLKYLLENLKMDVNSLNFDHQTPLHRAASETCSEVIEYLILQGAEINKKTLKDNLTPLHIATDNNSIIAAEILIKKGADITIKSNKGYTALQCFSAGINRGNFDAKIFSFIPKEHRYELLKMPNLDPKVAWKVLMTPGINYPDDIPSKFKSSIKEVLEIQKKLQEKPLKDILEEFSQNPTKKYALSFLFHNYVEAQKIALEEGFNKLFIEECSEIFLKDITSISLAEIPKLESELDLDKLHKILSPFLSEDEEENFNNFYQVITKKKNHIGFPVLEKNPEEFYRMHAEIENSIKVITHIAEELHQKASDDAIKSFSEIKKDHSSNDKEYIEAEKSLGIYGNALLGLYQTFSSSISKCATAWKNGFKLIYSEQKTVPDLDCFRKWGTDQSTLEDTLDPQVKLYNGFYEDKIHNLEEIMIAIAPENTEDEDKEGGIDVHYQNAFWERVRGPYHLNTKVGNDPLADELPDHTIEAIDLLFSQKVNLSKTLITAQNIISQEIKSKPPIEFMHTKAYACFAKLAEKFSSSDTTDFITQALGIEVNDDEDAENYITFSTRGPSLPHISLLLRELEIVG